MADPSDSTSNLPLPQPYIDAIKGFEGFTPKAQWDYSQHSNGYGTRALYPGEVIDQQEATDRLHRELGSAASQVDARYPDLPAGQRAALTSLTYNAGPGWMRSGLGAAVGAGDWDTAGRLFLGYNKAGGQVLPGLANRRAAEATWLSGAVPGLGAAPSPSSAVALVQAQSAPYFAGTAQAPASAEAQSDAAADMTKFGEGLLAPQLGATPKLALPPAFRPKVAQPTKSLATIKPSIYFPRG
jgi:lysozyme